MRNNCVNHMEKNVHNPSIEREMFGMTNRLFRSNRRTSVKETRRNWIRAAWTMTWNNGNGTHLEFFSTSFFRCCCRRHHHHRCYTARCWMKVLSLSLFEPNPQLNQWLWEKKWNEMNIHSVGSLHCVPRKKKREITTISSSSNSNNNSQMNCSKTANVDKWFQLFKAHIHALSGWLVYLVRLWPIGLSSLCFSVFLHQIRHI